MSALSRIKNQFPQIQTCGARLRPEIKGGGFYCFYSSSQIKSKVRSVCRDCSSKNKEELRGITSFAVRVIDIHVTNLELSMSCRADRPQVRNSLSRPARGDKSCSAEGQGAIIDYSALYVVTSK